MDPRLDLGLDPKEMIEGFIDTQVIGRGLDGRTEKAYRLDLEHFYIWLEQKQLAGDRQREKTWEEEMEAYLDHLLYGKGLRPSTISRKQRVLSYYLAYLVKRGALSGCRPLRRVQVREAAREEASKAGQIKAAAEDAAPLEVDQGKTTLSGDAQGKNSLSGDARRKTILPGEILPETVWSKDVLARDIQREDVRTGDIQARDVQTRDIRREDVRMRDIQAGDVQARDIQREDVRMRDIQAGDVQTRDVQREDVRMRDIQAGDVQIGNVRTRDVLEGAGTTSSRGLLSKKEVDLFFRAINREYADLDSSFRKRVCLRDLVMMELLFYHGVEISELLRMEVSDYDRKTGMLTVRRKRDRSYRVYLFSQALREQMGMWLEERGYFERDGGYRERMFLSKLGRPLSMKMVIMIFDKYRVMAGIEKGCTPKDLKKSMKRYARELLMEQCG